MKKKLEADLMSIAHRVLQMKNKSDINQLYIETQKLYEKLAVLRFVEEHFEGPKPTIGQAEIVEKMKHFFDEIHVADPLIQSVEPKIIIGEVIVEEEIEEEVITTKAVVETAEEEFTAEDDSEIVAEELIETKESKEFGFLPAFALDKVADEEDVVVIVDEAEPNKADEVQISFMDLLGGNYSEPMFVKVDQSEKAPSKIAFDAPKETNFQTKKQEFETPVEIAKIKTVEAKSVSLNDKFAKGITIGLNDRIAFVKHLFGNSDEDYSRVMSQLITYDNFEEAQSFIEDMVKPDYNSWEGKEDYSQRFLEIIEKKFA